MLRNLKNRGRALAVALTGFVLVGVASAQATASFDLSGLAEQTTTDITSVFTTALPVMIAATALVVAWKYARRLFRGV